MSTASRFQVEAEGESFAPYRAISRAAVISLILGFLSIAAFLSPVFAVIPVMGMFFGLLGWLNVRRLKNELTGGGFAVAGMIVCGVLLLSSLSLHAYTYVTEVPEGYQRIFFSQLRPERGSREIIAPTARELDGKRVFVRGYVHPGVANQGAIREFILVPDMGTCCFGGQPKLTDMITVTLRDPLRVQYSQRLQRLGGVLKVNEQLRPVAGGLQGGIFELDADYMQ